MLKPSDFGPRSKRLMLFAKLFKGCSVFKLEQNTPLLSQRDEIKVFTSEGKMTVPLSQIG